VRVIQQARRDAGLSVSDRIMLTIDAADSVIEAARVHEALVRSETLALEVAYGQVPGGVEGKVGEGQDVRIEIAKAG